MTLVSYTISKETLLNSILQGQNCPQEKAKVQIDDGCKAALSSVSKKMQVNGWTQVGCPNWQIIWYINYYKKQKEVMVVDIKEDIFLFEVCLSSSST